MKRFFALLVAILVVAAMAVMVSASSLTTVGSSNTIGGSETVSETTDDTTSSPDTGIGSSVLPLVLVSAAGLAVVAVVSAKSKESR